MLFNLLDQEKDQASFSSSIYETQTGVARNWKLKFGGDDLFGGRKLVLQMVHRSIVVFFLIFFFISTVVLCYK